MEETEKRQYKPKEHAKTLAAFMTPLVFSALEDPIFRKKVSERIAEEDAEEARGGSI